MLGRGLRGARTEAHGRSGRTRGCAQRDPPPSVRGLAHRGAGSVRVKQSRSGPPDLDPCPDLDSGPCPSRSPDPGPDPGPRPEPTWSAAWAAPQRGPRPRRASPGPSARGVPGRAQVTVPGPPLAPVQDSLPEASAARGSPPPLSRPVRKEGLPARRPSPRPAAASVSIGREARQPAPIGRARGDTGLPLGAPAVRLCRPRPLVE